MARYIKLAETKSTNTYMKGVAAELPHATVIYTYRQTAGRGQIGNSWESEDGKNLTFSMLLKPPGIDVQRQFYISEAASLALADMLSQYTPDIKIKWPNDIYYRDQKICGMLIENVLNGGGIAYSIIGIGLNINQDNFVSNAPNPVSLKNITGTEYDTEALLRDLCNRIETLCNFNDYSKADLQALHERYLATLYRNDGDAHQWQLPDGTIFSGTIVDVQPDGKLTLRHEADGSEHQYYFKEVKHVINHHIL